MKKLLFTAFMAIFAVAASAQISEGAPSAKKYATGNRPTKGTFGLYFGVESDLFGYSKGDFGVKPLPIVNLKYMVTDNVEARIGMRFWKERDNATGTMDKDDDKGYVDETSSWKRVTSDNQIRPGVAYHFTRSNLLDVYTGIEGIFGWKRNTIDEKHEIDGKDAYTYKRDARIQLGVGAFIGLQAYIARLPLAIGLEYGFGAMWDGAIRQKTTTKAVDADEVVTYAVQDDFYHGGFASNVTNQKGENKWDGLKARKGEWGSQVRLTISYFFNR